MRLGWGRTRKESKGDCDYVRPARCKSLLAVAVQYAVPSVMLDTIGRDAPGT